MRFASPAPSSNEQDIRNVNFVVGERIFRLGDIAEVRRGSADPPQPMFRVNGQPAIGLAIAMRDSGDILALGRNIRAAMDEIRADLPIGIEPILVADQSVTVDEAIGDFTDSLWQAILIIMAASFIALGMRAGVGRGAVDPADAGHRLPADVGLRHRPAAHLAGRADHRADAAGR